MRYETLGPCHSNLHGSYQKVVSLPLGGAQAFFNPMAPLPENLAVANGAGSRNSIIGSIVRRKQVSLDLLAPENAFFEEDENTDDSSTEEDEATSKLFFPLKFPKRKQAEGDLENGDVEAVVHPIRKAGRKDIIKTGILAAILIAFVGVCVGWKTHEDESHSLFGLVGTACVTQCLGDKDYRNFFVGHEDHFDSGDVSC